MSNIFPGLFVMSSGAALIWKREAMVRARAKYEISRGRPPYDAGQENRTTIMLGVVTILFGILLMIIP